MTPIIITIGFINRELHLNPSRFSKKVGFATSGSRGSGKGSGWRLCVRSARALAGVVAVTSKRTVGHTLCVSSTSSRYAPGATACSLKLPSLRGMVLYSPPFRTTRTFSSGSSADREREARHLSEGEGTFGGISVPVVNRPSTVAKAEGATDDAAAAARTKRKLSMKKRPLRRRGAKPPSCRQTESPAFPLVATVHTPQRGTACQTAASRRQA